jgi:hypothetical protein
LAFDLAQFLAEGLVYGGARPSKFDIQATLPPAISGSIDPSSVTKLQFTAMAASIPAFALGMVEIPYFGRKIKSSGDRVWDDWRIQVMLDEDYNTRAMFEAWNNSINALTSNFMLASEDSTSPSNTLAGFTEENYKSNWTISHYGKDQSTIRQYTLIGAWPRVIGEMALDWSQTNRIMEFPVTVSFDTMVPLLEGAKGNATIYGDAV